MGDSSDYRKRIEALNGKPLENRPVAGADIEDIRRKVKKLKERSRALVPETVTAQVDVPKVKSKPAPAIPEGEFVRLESAVQGVEISVPYGGKAFLIENRLNSERMHMPSVCEALKREFEHPETRLLRRLSSICEVDGLQPEDLLVMDLETTGLSNSPVFLVGVMVWEDDTLVVRQYLARDYSEEAAITSLFVQDLRTKKLLVTFNGKTFDMPYMRMRAAANAIPFAPEPPHLDMLHEARKIWRRRLPDCKLQTLERHICGVHRTGDIPGRDIPEAYHAFVRTSNAAQIVKILHHNALDLVTVADLMTRME